MRYSAAICVVATLSVGALALADEHEISGDLGASSIRWVNGGRRSAVTGPVIEPGKDGPWRVHVKVKNGDLVLFTDSTVVFENGAGEQNDVWEISEFLNGNKGTIGPLTNPMHKAFYPNPDKALVTDGPPMGVGQPIFLIRIKNLTADKPILFASGEVSHIDKSQGSKHFMFGAIVLDTQSK